jgi:hypothetical protein
MYKWSENELLGPEARFGLIKILITHFVIVVDMATTISLIFLAMINKFQNWFCWCAHLGRHSSAMLLLPLVGNEKCTEFEARSSRRASHCP